MFKSLTDNLNSVFQKLRGKSILSEDDFNASVRQIRVALLEADVSLEVAKSFTEEIKNEVIGKKIIKGISSAQMIIKIVQDHLVKILGSEKSELNIAGKSPVVIMLVGLQGAGKTTTAAKLALKLKKNKKVMLASLDIYRPAAQKQLEMLGKQINVSTLPIIQEEKPKDITARALKTAKSEGYEILILDTAGRMHLDLDMMDELKVIKELSSPQEILLVADSMTGQDAINIAKSFNDSIALTGIIFTRVDGDARGGAILSMKIATNCPIKFLGYGEKLNDLEDFYPERIAKRILDMGDVVSLVERATEIAGQEEIDKLQKKVQKGKFDLNDLASQLKTLSKMGGMASIMKFIPSIGSLKQQVNNSIFDDGDVKKYIAIINSMTKKERVNPDILNGSRRLRIAKGAGLKVSDINFLIKQYNKMSALVSGFSKHNKIKDHDVAKLLNKKY
ncbi:signal recognition particle protein [Candidatus Mesenet endosymbiont of Phosphuga atrata]|uniref:signal recognition particle protein n=1 Tax=Candidatus Mesenet endosymbiont of Phosphuga atrata TaxID=3066221 RepID=UPI0030D3AB44